MRTGYWVTRKSKEASPFYVEKIPRVAVGTVLGDAPLVEESPE